MSLKSYLHQNVLTLDRYENLQKNGKNPKLSVFCGRTLKIVSYKANGFFEKISLLIQAILFSVAKLCGLLKVDEPRVKKLKEEVGKYHLKRAESYYSESLKDLGHEKEVLASEVGELSEQKSAQNKIVEELTGQRDKLQSEIQKEQETFDRNRNIYSNARLDDLKHEMEVWKEKILRLQEEYNAYDYKNKIWDLERENNRLKAIVNCESSQETQRGKQRNSVFGLF